MQIHMYMSMYECVYVCVHLVQILRLDGISDVVRIEPEMYINYLTNETYRRTRLLKFIAEQKQKLKNK